MMDVLVPKIVSVFREGYDLKRLRMDALAGLTVAIVALPLSMAIAIASGIGPDRGLYTAIVGGFLVSLFGGSLYQIGGPAGAFIVLVSATVTRHGIDGLVLAVALSGVFLLIGGALRLGKYIRFIPFPVTVGFTAGIAIIIFASQLTEVFGLTLAAKEPGPLVEKIPALLDAAHTLNPAALCVALLTIAIIITLKRYRPKWPGLLIAVCVASVLVAGLSLPVETIGSRFGSIPNGLPTPALPVFSLDLLVAVLPDAIAFALLGAIESLLSAVVADGMTGRRHRSSMELIGQGIANIGSALFGGMSVTGTIARTATNIRSGGTSPVSGILHAVFLLVFMLAAAPLASYIPLAALAGLLVVVSWNMIEKPAIAALLKSGRGEAAVLIVTFLLVVFRTLIEGIVAGFALGAILFIHRMGQTIRIETEHEGTSSSQGDPSATPETVVYRITGVLFFGATAKAGAVMDATPIPYRHLIIDCSGISLIDSTGIQTFETLIHKAQKRGASIFITGADSKMRTLLETHAIHEPAVTYASDITAAKTLIAKL